MFNVIRIPTKFLKPISRLSKGDKAELFDLLCSIGASESVILPDNSMGDLLALIYGEWMNMEGKNGKKPDKSLIIDSSEGLGVTCASDSDSRVEESRGEENINQQKIDNDFNLFWSKYPNKQGKKEAKEKFTKLIKSGVSSETIISAIDKYKRVTKPQYYKHGSTWLNQEVFRDYEKIEQPKREVQVIEDDYNMQWDIIK